MTEDRSAGVPRAGWTADELATLAAVAETIVRGGAERRARLAAALCTEVLDPDDLAALRRAVRLFESPVANLLLAGRPTRFRDMDPAARERYLLGWARSRIAQRRVAFTTLKRLLAFLAYADPGESGRNPRWAQVGYVPQLAGLTAAPTPIRPEDLPDLADGGGGRDPIVLEADVVVVGSGAGGGVVAAALAEAGRAVIVVEAGPFVAEPGMPTTEMAGFERLYLDRGATPVVDGAVALLAGACVGGGTVVNWTNCVAPPDEARAEWAGEHGLGDLEAHLDADLAALESELGVTPTANPGPKDAAILRGGAALGLDAMPTRRNAACDDCGSCSFGCRQGTKGSGLRVHLARAHAAGARIVADAEVRRVVVEGGRAAGVEAVVRPTAAGVPIPGSMPRRLTVRCRQVVLAAGALRTPAVLARSGILHPAVGAHLRVQPVAVAIGRYREPIPMWMGPLQAARIMVPPDAGAGTARYVVEGAPGHPGLAALALPWEGTDDFDATLAGLAHLGAVIGVCRDRDAGRVALSRHGRVRIQYRVSARDAATMRAALRTMVRVIREAGALSLAAVETPVHWFNRAGGAPGDLDAAFERYVAALDGWSAAPGRGMVFSAHQLGTARMGAGRAAHACDPEGRVRRGPGATDGTVPGLYVADGSLFPTALGVNPMLTIMALARHVARTVAAEG